MSDIICIFGKYKHDDQTYGLGISTVSELYTQQQCNVILLGCLVYNVIIENVGYSLIEEYLYVF